MENAFPLVKPGSKIKTILADLTILTFIYFLPAISHLFAFPVYYADPMRIALVFAMILGSRKNAYLIALTLPVFSFLISSHPSIVKSLLIGSELIINLVLFYLIKDSLKNIFLAFFASILLSKTIYYLLKFFLLSSGILEDSLFSTPFIFQALAAVMLSAVIFSANRFGRKEF